MKEKHTHTHTLHTYFVYFHDIYFHYITNSPGIVPTDIFT